MPRGQWEAAYSVGLSGPQTFRLVILPQAFRRVAFPLAGNSRGARQVPRLLHSMSKKHDLPWHRVGNAQGKISLYRGRGYELQRALLESEGVGFSLSRTIDFDIYLWMSQDPEE